jgi:hypothetical protein
VLVQGHPLSKLDLGLELDPLFNLHLDLARMLVDQQQLVLLDQRLVKLRVVLKKVLHQRRGLWALFLLKHTIAKF